MKPIVQERLADEVYQQLREYIFQNSHPADQKIDIEKIAEQLRVSRQPVVEATNRLAQEGLFSRATSRRNFRAPIIQCRTYTISWKPA